MTNRKLLATIGGLVFLAACSPDRTGPTSPVSDHHSAVVAAPTTGSLLSNIPVTGTLPGGGTFSGLVSLTNLALQNGQLVGSGTLTGTATQGSVVTQITQTFTNVPLSLLPGTGGSCQILTLDIGAIHLDLLGLVVDLAPVHLNIHAQSGSGNLLGNLLCALTHLLDNPSTTLAGLQNLLNQINGILAGL